MNIIDQAKIHLYLNQQEYWKLEELIRNKEENEKYIFKYIVNKFSSEVNAICTVDLIKILNCMHDKYILRTLCYLEDEPNFQNNAFGLILKDKNFNNAISNKRNSFISHYIDHLNFMDIINLYNAENTTDKDREFIKECLREKINKPYNAYNLAIAQQFTETVIILPHFIEEKILESNEVSTIHGLMNLRGYDNRKLLNKLALMKDKSAYHKRCFIAALTEFFPEDLAKVPFGLVVEDIISSIDDTDTCTELIVNASNAIAKKIQDNATHYEDKDAIKKEPVKIMEHM